MAEKDSYFEELQSAYLYEVMARRERGGARAILFHRLAQEARSQSELWKTKLAKQGIKVSEAEFTPSLRAKIVAFLIERIGPRGMMPILAAMKVRGISVYQHPVHGDEKRIHRAIKSGGNLRAAVFGINDGLVSNTSLVLGIVGAAADQQMVLLSGAAGLMAGAFSMAAGEYISVRTQRELFEYQIGLERDELNEYPQEEAHELALIYEAKGISADEAKTMANTIIADPERALDTLAREELGLNPDDLGSPWKAAIYSFVAFSIGAIVPLVPLFVFESPLKWVVGFSGASLFSVGLVMSLFTGRGALWGGLRMLLIGALAGLVTYGIGSVLGVSLS